MTHMYFIAIPENPVFFRSPSKRVSMLDIIRLEEKIAHQDMTLSELNRIVIDQQKKIDLLIKEVISINEKMKSIQGNGIKDLAEETPPPHY